MTLDVKDTVMIINAKLLVPAGSAVWRGQE